VLEQAAETGVLIPLHRGDDLGLRALELAFDYTAIADTLPPKVVASVRKELQQSLAGPLAPPETAQGPLQLQSQFIVRAALARAGEVPIHPTHSPKLGRATPDLLLERGLGRYALEVKRPTAAKNAVPRLEDAHGQLSDYGLPGAILIDLTDCLKGIPGEELDLEVRRLTLSLYDRVFVTGVGHRPGYSNIMVVGTFARVAWQPDDRAATRMVNVNVHTVSTICVFATQPGTLADHRARWIRASLEDGFGRLYRTIGERDVVAVPAVTASPGRA
jgi:hypothetical protein